VVAAVLCAGGGLLAAVRRGPVRAARPPRGRLHGIEWALPLGALVALFAAFVTLQFATLFGGDGVPGWNLPRARARAAACPGD
jgi:hypothetical protein